MKPLFGELGPMDDGRPFTGAWIETGRDRAGAGQVGVAPSRGRGLKLLTRKGNYIGK